MLYLSLFLLGVIFDRYVMVLLDYLLGWISNKYTLSTSYTQAEIDQINAPVEANVIGFHIPSESEDEEIYEEDKLKSSTRFIKNN